MLIPNLDVNGNLPPGIHAASFAEVAVRFGGSLARLQQIELLREVIAAALNYPTIKRILVWGSFVTTKPEPNDMDYSIVVSALHHLTNVEEAHRRFLVPSAARIYYGVDVSYLSIKDYPLGNYIERISFVCANRKKEKIGIVEINLRGEVSGGTDGQR